MSTQYIYVEIDKVPRNVEQLRCNPSYTWRMYKINYKEYLKWTLHTENHKEYVSVCKDTTGNNGFGFNKKPLLDFLFNYISFLVLLNHISL